MRSMATVIVRSGSVIPRSEKLLVTCLKATALSSSLNTGISDLAQPDSKSAAVQDMITVLFITLGYGRTRFLPRDTGK